MCRSPSGGIGRCGWIKSDIGWGAIAVESIDTGKMNGTIHGVSAVIYFLFACVDVMICTYHAIYLKTYRPKLQNDTSLLLKEILSVVSIITLALCVIAAL